MSKLGCCRLVDVPCHLAAFDEKATLVVEGHVVVGAVQDHLVALVHLSDLLQKLDDPLAKVLASVSLINDDILDVSAEAQIPYKLPLDEQRARADNPARADVLHHNYLVNVFQSREQLIEALPELESARLAHFGQPLEGLQEPLVKIGPLQPPKAELAVARRPEQGQLLRSPSRLVQGLYHSFYLIFLLN